MTTHRPPTPDALRDTVNIWKAAQAVADQERAEFAAQVQASVDAGMSQRAVARLTKVHRLTISKMVREG